MLDCVWRLKVDSLVFDLFSIAHVYCCVNIKHFNDLLCKCTYRARLNSLIWETLPSALDQLKKEIWINLNINVEYILQLHDGLQLLSPCSWLFWTFQQIIMQMNIGREILPFNVIKTLPSTSDLLEIWINLNINVTNLNSFWNVMTGNKTALYSVMPRECMIYCWNVQVKLGGWVSVSTSPVWSHFVAQTVIKILC